MIKVLFLSAWYPNRYDAMAGLFVRKHAEAVSLYCDVTVLYVHPDKQIKHFEIVHQHINSNAREVIIYFPENSKGFFRKLIKIFHYFKANYIGYKEVKKTSGKPDITHVNILTRTGLIGYLIKITDKVPYVVTEHWSRYLKNRNSYHGYIRKALTKQIVKNASALLPVTKGLGEAMIMHKLYNQHYETVNNVVDDFFFSPIIRNKVNKKRILHVSCFDELAKNIYGILRAVKQLSMQRNDFELILVGAGINYEDTKTYATSLNFNDNIVYFTGELSPQDVAIQFKQADFFVLFSNYENSPVVISESLSCGKPVLSSNVGGISEHINQTNGILIPSKDENALTEKLNFMLDHYQEFDSEAIQKNALQLYSYTKVGDQLHNIYKGVLYEIQ